MKSCRKCHISYPLENFYRTKVNKDGRRSYCKSCDNTIKNQSINSSSESLSAHKASKRKEKLKSRYGITPVQWDNMVKSQEFKCAIPYCNTELKKDKFTHVDHQEKPFKVRGLLCKSCNNALGLIKDDFNRAIGLAKYLQLHKGVI